MTLPRILVIDDLFGRVILERRNLCKVYRLIDITGDDATPIFVEEPVAQAVFCSAQRMVTGGVDNSVDLAIDAVRRGWANSDGARWALCLLDLRFVSGTILDDGMPAGNTGDDDFGLIVLREFQRNFPELPVVILSGRERSEVIEECRRLGASDFIQRHYISATDPPHLVLAEKLRGFGLMEDRRGVIIGRSIALLRALASARRGGTGSGNILLLGESGTGKELFARYLHENSPRAIGPYKVFHAFGTAETLQEDLLFGHERGAFTGAERERAGLFEEADSGTLFIDEVGDISEGLQSRLLRPIESRVVSRQGSTREIPVSVQLVLATNKALDEYARTARFKVDLLNRINAYTIQLPPLRNRREDIPLLANQLLKSLCLENNARWPRQIDDEAMQHLIAHDWQDGNVRELRNVLERAVKNNKDAEIVVVTDLWLRTSNETTSLERDRVVAIPSGHEHGRWDESSVLVASYDDMFGSWPVLQRGVAMRLGCQLVSALRVTARRDARNGSARANLAGAVGCLLGWKVTTVEAADFIKRVMRFDEPVFKELCEKFPLLQEAVGLALRSRPKRGINQNMTEMRK